MQEYGFNPSSKVVKSIQDILALFFSTSAPTYGEDSPSVQGRAQGGLDFGSTVFDTMGDTVHRIVINWLKLICIIWCEEG